MNTPTPDPHAERKVIADALAHADDDTASVEPSWVLDEEYYLGQADVVLAALDLPARDARVRAKVTEEIAEHLGRLAAATTSTAARGAWRTAAALAREHAGKGFNGDAQPSAVPAEGSGHPHPATRVLSVFHPVAEGRCENCGDPVVYNLAVDYAAHRDDDGSMTCTKPWPAIPPRLSLDTPEGASDAH